MYGVEQRDGPVPTVVLRDSDAESSVVLAPTRGGMLIGFSVGRRELLYLDRKTFEDPSSNVRGGVPVLFPSPGKLTGDAWAWQGAKGAMKQHGFARNLPWVVAASGTENGAWVTLSLASSEASRAHFPFEFVAMFTYRLRGASVAIEMSVENTGASPMPFGVGFHPYFAVPDADKSAVRIPTRATRAFDNKRKCDIDFSGFDLGADEVDLHLHDHGAQGATLLSNAFDIELRGSADFSHWVVWTLRGRDFVCLEPWTCPGDALNTGERLTVLAPGEVRSLCLEIACTGGRHG